MKPKRPTTAELADLVVDLDGFAAMLQIEKRTLHNYRQDGRIPPETGNVSGSPWWDRRVILEWIPTRPGRGAGGGPKPKNRSQP